MKRPQDSVKRSSPSRAPLTRAIEDAARHGRRNFLERLEDRRLLSVSVHNGILNVTGTAGNDNIALWADARLPQTQIDVQVNRAKIVAVDAATIQGIYIEGLAGNDKIQFRETFANIYIPTTIVGGAGNDSIVGNQGSDALIDTQGNNIFLAGVGDNTILGGAGTDHIIAQGGNNVINGGGGHDLINTGGGHDRISHHDGDTINTGAAAMAATQTATTTSGTRAKRYPPTAYGLQPTDIHRYALLAPSGYGPAKIRHAYGLDLLNPPNKRFPTYTNSGAGQTIVIVDAYDDPNIQGDLHVFDSQFGLADPPSLNVIYASGTQPLDASLTGWDGEIALDVEWAHAMAPQANIILVEADTAFTADLELAENVAAQQVQASGGIVSMSFGVDETSPFADTPTEEGIFTNPAYGKVTFMAASGDFGTAVTSYPATSPNVVSVGGTTAQIDAGGNITSEKAWSMGGGDYSTVFAQPGYQNGLTIGGAAAANHRAEPDVSLNADPATGYAVYDSLDGSFWSQVGGTSASCPCWAGFAACMNELRQDVGKQPLGNGFLGQLYNVTRVNAADNFNDITTGSNGHPALVGFDLATGWGTPKLQYLIPSMAGYLTGPLSINADFIYNLTGPLSGPGVVDFKGAATAKDTADTVTMVATLVSNNGVDPTDYANLTIAGPFRRSGNIFRGYGSVTTSINGTVYTFRLRLDGSVADTRHGVIIRGNLYAIDALGHPLPQGPTNIFTGTFTNA